MYFETVTLPMQIKAIIQYRNLTIGKVRSDYNQKFGTNFSQQSFSRKINDGAFKFEELQKLGEILNFKVRLDVVENEKE